MRKLLSEGPINVPAVFQGNTVQHKSDRISVLVARRTASRLQDAALTSLFRSYRVELFQDPFDLFVSRSNPISYALLCASAGYSLLAAEAHIIRKQWPLARIMLLGSAPHELEDHLYDDTVAPDCNAASLATAFETHSIDLRNRSIGWNHREADLPRFPKESDPTKADPSDLLQPPIPAPRDLPSDETQDLTRRASLISFVLATGVADHRCLFQS
jgi:hypothetical protein